MWGLVGREAELRELAAYRTEPGRGAVCMVAGAGVGGQVGVDVDVCAAPSCRGPVVSFFITARLAAQDTREAFTEVVLEAAG